MDTLVKEEQATLPDTLWELAQVALKDLIETEKMQDRYEIDMSEWYQTNGKCSLCMAGAVAAQTLGAGDRGKNSLFNMFPHLSEKFSAIDDLRLGCIRAAHWRMYGKYPDKDIPNVVLMPDYEDDPEKFKEAFRDMIVKLKEYNM